MMVEYRIQSAMHGIVALLAVLFLATSAFAWPFGSDEKKENVVSEDSLKRVQLKKLQREVDALEHIRLQRADSLEKKEAAHWRHRYAESKLTEDHQNEIRELDSRYSKLSTDLGRVNEELTASKDVRSDSEEKAKSEENSLAAFNTQVKLSLEKILGEAPGDYPVKLNDRLLMLNKALGEANKKEPATLPALRGFFDDALTRHKFTYTQSFTEQKSQVGSRAEVNVSRLRLGTVFLGEVAKDNGDVQALLRTGALQGKVFEWNAKLPQEMAESIKHAVENSNQSILEIPLDVLQNKAVKSSITDTKELTTGEELQAFFKKGGIVMYPLALAAFFALLLCFERFIVLTLRGRCGSGFLKKIYKLVGEECYEEAANLCLSYNSSLSMVLFSVLNKAKESRDAAEKSLQEALLREQPKLERRMGLLAAIGSIAPLLGLLGTVTGIITLFTVITEVGTNDARVLAGGISEALVTTETGLVIAIPVMILHGLLSEKIEKVTSEMFVQSTALLNKLFPKDR